MPRLLALLASVIAVLAVLASPPLVAQTFTYVPLWGVAVGILTLGILVPMNTEFSCVK